MQIFVTGGAGFIGRHLVKTLLRENKVTIYDNLSCSTENDIASLVDLGAQFTKGDILDYDHLIESCKGHDVVIHLAAQSDVAESVLHPEATHKINVDGTINVINACKENKISKIIFASSAAVYGSCSILPITEKSETGPISPYGKSKLASETEIIASGLDHIILRIFNVYGEGQNPSYAGVITRFASRIAEEKPLVIYGDGTQTRDFVSVDDVVESFLCAISSHKNGTYNIATGQKISVKELAESMIAVSGKKIDIVFEPGKDGDIKNSYADITLARDELGFLAKKKLVD